MHSRHTGAIILCVFCCLVLGIALAFGPSLVQVIAGEDSAGSWMSGALLIISATTTAFIARRGWNPWFIFTIFFVLLAIDENFMIHEAIKRSIVFTSYEQTNQPGDWIGELPVIIAACVGAIVAWIMWKHIDKNMRWLIVVGVLFGAASVTFDVLAMGVLWEDSFKLIGELAVCCALVNELQTTHNKNE